MLSQNSHKHHQLQEKDHQALLKRRGESIEKLVAILHNPHIPPEIWGGILTTIENSSAWHDTGSKDQGKLAKTLLEAAQNKNIDQDLAVSIGLVLANNMQYLSPALQKTVTDGLAIMRKRFLKSL